MRVRPGRGFDAAGVGGDGVEDGVEPRDDLRFTADHQTVATIEAPDAATSSDVDVMDVLRQQVLRPGDVVAVVGVAAVDHRVARHPAEEPTASSVESTTAAGSMSHIDRGFVQLLHEVGQRRRTRGSFFGQSGHRVRVHVECDAAMPVSHQTPHQVRAHPAESNHSQLHGCVGCHVPPFNLPCLGQPWESEHSFRPAPPSAFHPAS